MDAFEIKDILKTFKILVDSREQRTDKALKRYESFSAAWERATLSYGDYTYNVRLPSGHWLLDQGEAVKGLCVIERKMSLDELASCFTHSRDRFEREFLRASEQGAKVHLLVEGASWENLINGKYRSKFTPNAYLASLLAWQVRYNIQLYFCKSETSGRLIKEILYRDLKERLERGDFNKLSIQP